MFISGLGHVLSISGYHMAVVAGVVFFAYIGFDAISTAAEEVKDPQRTMPRGIMLGLLVCTIIYVIVGAVATGLVPYKQLLANDPLAAAFNQAGLQRFSWFISLGAVVSMSAVLLVFQYGQPRIFFAMAPELPDPAFAKIVVLTPDAEAREALKHRLREAVSQGLAPEAHVRVTQLVFGPYTPFPVEFRVMGPDPAQLHAISEKALDIMRGVPDVRQANRDWGNRTPVLRFVLDQDRLGGHRERRIGLVTVPFQRPADQEHHR